MASITDRTAYLRGLADGMKLDKEQNEHKLLLEMLEVMDEMAHQLSDVDSDVEELQEYVDDIDNDLSDMEDVLFGEEDDCDCDGCCGDDDDEDEDGDEDEELSFDCPNCGHTVMVKASDIDFDESPVCEKCGQPFFIEVEEEKDDKE
ncbi:MAG: zinc ribbon domain-containing protein [Eubacteriales bacterium]|nr:zinc ribbon domain-containing protein [Eubacteriales bacterium]